ncbi:MAG: transposase [Thermosipho sp. (in: Bacteria)]|nr:transposase [Thermosipho sp. (in: thermotogales)]
MCFEHNNTPFPKDFLNKKYRHTAVRTTVRYPETNGRIEVFHKTLKYEHVYLKDHYPNILVARKEIDAFINYYNYQRLHQGIGFVIPEEMYTGKAEAIKASYAIKLKAAREKRIQANKSLNQYLKKTA